jgi:hypothetical protein
MIDAPAIAEETPELIMPDAPPVPSDEPPPPSEKTPASPIPTNLPPSDEPPANQSGQILANPTPDNTTAAATETEHQWLKRRKIELST